MHKLTVTFDSTSNFAHIPNKLIEVPAGHGLNAIANPVAAHAMKHAAVKLRKAKGWRVVMGGNGGTIVDRADKTLIGFTVVDGWKV